MSKTFIAAPLRRLMSKKLNQKRRWLESSQKFYSIIKGLNNSYVEIQTAVVQLSGQ